MAAHSKGIPFEKVGYYLIALLVIALLGFWPSYFSKFFGGLGEYNFYFHFHAIVMMLWVISLIVQPILIHKKQLSWHRKIGKASYILFPLVILAGTLLAHHRAPFEENLAAGLFIPFKDIIVLLVAYGIAIYYRKNPAIHARGMIATAIPFLEPALVRFLSWSLPNSFPLNPYLCTIIVMDSILVYLILRERKAKQGRWVFPLILGLYFIIQTIILFRLKIPGWAALAEWFAALPIT